MKPKLPDMENLVIELAYTSKSKEEIERRLELIELLKDYFGEEDTRLILAVALYFKNPSRWSILYKDLIKALTEELS